MGMYMHVYVCYPHGMKHEPIIRAWGYRHYSVTCACGLRVEGTAITKRKADAIAAEHRHETYVYKSR